ncbi:TetR/AcrR family transcriptional regulator [Antrihabitans sp. YC2-6]|uniref:TetR/AcrR family transcriptional regulator n=1 Tax=Antrihabitans sp. YC2-6 TaxID=2799498 RepID=UPI0027DCA4CA|nr:TetR/AcrR family transcriptional regulator [Antrihabitans sp. YC2-6]
MTNGQGGRVTIRPARGTRPANRRELIVAAAADLFYRNGYANVSMSDIADAVAIGPSALYRHFRSKETLLATVVGDALVEMQDALAATLADPAGDISETLAALGLRNRPAGVLWQREGRYLAADTRTELRRQTRTAGERIAAVVRRQRPELSETGADLLAWCALAIAQSISYHSLHLPIADFRATLAAMIDAAVDTALPALDPVPAVKASRGVLRAPTRRETILIEATRLFAEQGFSNVSLDDVGVAIGASGPSIYNHFAGKSDILLAAMHRGEEWLQMDMTRSLARASGPQDALIGLLRNYVTFTFDNPHLVQLISSELLHLPSDERERARAAQHTYIGEWVYLLEQVHPEWDNTHARIRVLAVQIMMNHIALTPHLRRFSSVDSVLMSIGASLLEVDPEPA